MIVVTGGAGFIGSNFVRSWICEINSPVVTLDLLTYAGNLSNLAALEHHPLHHFVQGDINNRSLVRKLLEEFQPKAIVHFAAETHVDRSIYHPENFIQTNIVGTFHLLEETRVYWKQLDEEQQRGFRFLNVSTDEVYGSLDENAPPSKEREFYAPNSPYGASKASSDHLVRAYHQTYQLPTLTAHSSNNYGPYQFPEKLIPLMIVQALCGKILPIYGDGLNTRNWLFVEDHCEALRLILAQGRPGETYNIGDQNELTNREIVERVCAIIDELSPHSPYVPHSSLIKFVKDRPAHDRRYSLDSSKIREELGWNPKESFKNNLRQTVKWYLENRSWVEKVMTDEYRAWIRTHYTERES